MESPDARESYCMRRWNPDLGPDCNRKPGEGQRMIIFGRRIYPGVCVRRSFGVQLGRALALVAASLLFSGCAPGDSSEETVDGEAGESLEAEVESEKPKVKPASLVGLTADEVELQLGTPKGRMSGSKGMTWTYPGYIIEFSKSNTVVKAEGLVIRKPKAAPIPAVMAHKKGGAKVDIKSLMPPGKVTIIDFYADWCGPCRAISPQLEELAKSDPEVVLRKVDIVNWETPVVRQYGISSIPNMQVFDRNKKPMGAGTSSLARIKRDVAKAKRD